MDFFEPIRKAVMAGFGAQEKLKEVVDELIKRGEISESQGVKLVKEWSEKAEKSTAEFNQSVTDFMGKAMDQVSLAPKSEVEALKKQIEELSARIRDLEGQKG
jgi:polyhydroxyalkanoate synthesis regulator phasin